MAPGQGEDFLGMNLKQRLRGHRRDRIRSLWAIKPEAGPRPTGNDHDGDFSLAEHRLADGGDVTPGDPFAVGPRESVDDDGLDIIDADRRFALAEVTVQLGDLIEVDGGGFRHQVVAGRRC